MQTRYLLFSQMEKKSDPLKFVKPIKSMILLFFCRVSQNISFKISSQPMLNLAERDFE